MGAVENLRHGIRIQIIAFGLIDFDYFLLRIVVRLMSTSMNKF